MRLWYTQEQYKKKYTRKSESFKKRNINKSNNLPVVAQGADTYSAPATFIGTRGGVEWVRRGMSSRYELEVKIDGWPPSELLDGQYFFHSIAKQWCVGPVQLLPS